VMKSNPGQIEKIFVNKLARPRSMRTDTFFKMEDAIYDKIR
jgi:ABC-type nitrate/sulfonate/bicarbonate transport system ATPase subunit